MENVFFTCEEVAARYNVKVSTVWAWIRKKKLAAICFGRHYRITQKDIEKFEAERKTI